jgi:hypothetical protein
MFTTHAAIALVVAAVAGCGAYLLTYVATDGNAAAAGLAAASAAVGGLLLANTLVAP